MISSITRKTLRRALFQSNKSCFSIGINPYDWRDNPDLNPNFSTDPRGLGCVDPYTHHSPCKYGKTFYPSRDSVYEQTGYDPKNLNQNFIGFKPQKTVAELNTPWAPHGNEWQEIAHEHDYESQDLDFQPQHFSSQHFRKKGPVWMWVIVALLPIGYVFSEIVYQQMTNGDGIKYQRPPPLDYPNDEDTPDTDTYNNWQSVEFTWFNDAGIVSDPYFDIVDGKKVYNKWAGVNQPHPVLR